MLYEIVKTKRFKTAYKRIKNLPGFKKDVFSEVVLTLASGEALSEKYRDHNLTGNLRNFRECHLASDILLLYQIDDGILILTLVSIGNHAQLFR
jgi:mRNA interferase YafQ